MLQFVVDAADRPNADRHHVSNRSDRQWLSDQCHVPDHL
jgi:hypothetical protein